MSIVYTPWRIVALVVLLVAAITPPVAMAQADDTIAQRLAAARVKYERDMEAVRKQVNDAIDKKIDEASKTKKVDTDKIKRATDEKLAFQAIGAWPDVPNLTRIKNVAAAAATDLQAALGKAMGEYSKSGNLGLAEAIANDVEHFKTQTDVVPWGPNLVEKESSAVRTLAPGGKPLTVDLGVKGEYRIDIRGKWTGDAGALMLEIPLVSGKRLAIPVRAGGDGEARVLLTVCRGFVGADFGAARPVDLSKATSGGSGAAVLFSERGTFAVESVVVKTVVEGAPPTAEESAKKAKDRDDPKRAVVQDAFAQGRKWAGLWDGNGCDIEVVERGANDAAIRISRANGAVFRLEGSVVNNVFSLRAIKHVRVAQGGVARFFTRQSGTAFVRDGLLYVDCTTTNDVGNLKNQKFDVSISGAESK